MKTDALKKRLDRNRPMTTITIRMPEDVIEDLKRIAPLLGFSGYQPLARAYIGQGLRTDLERLEGDTVSALIASLKRHGVSDEILQEALGEVTQKSLHQVVLAESPNTASLRTEQKLSAKIRDADRRTTPPLGGLYFA